MAESTNPKDKIGRTKPPLHLIPPTAMVEEAVVMGLGAVKYGPFNWRDHSVAASVYVGAALRHIAQWFDGQDTDPESGASHLAHARACMGILIDAGACDKLVDDRPPAGKTAELIARYTKPVAKAEEKKVDSVASIEYTAMTAGHGEPAPVSDTPFGMARSDLPQSRRLTKDEDYGVVCRLRQHGCGAHVARLIATAIRIPATQIPSGGPVVYPSGPMRGYEDYNFPAFDGARDAFLAEGYTVISPADIDRAAGDAEDNITDIGKFIFRDFHVLFYIASRSGSIAMLPGWEKSTGAVAEFFLARWLGLRILDATTGKPLTKFNAGHLTTSVLESLAKQTA